MKLKLFDPKKDAFDDIQDAFDGVDLPTDEKILNSTAFEQMVAKAVQKAVDGIQIPKAPAAPPQIIREVRVEVPKKDTRDLVEASTVEALKKRIEELEGELKETTRIARTPAFVPGGSGVIGIPDPGQATAGHVLTVTNTSDGKKARFSAGTGGSGVSLSGYTVNNGSSLKTFDVSDTSLDEIARVLGQVITELQA